MSELPVIVLCGLCDDPRFEPCVGSTAAKCSACQEAIWLTGGTLKTLKERDISNYILVCLLCYAKEEKRAVRLEPLSKHQLKEIRETKERDERMKSCT